MSNNTNTTGRMLGYARVSTLDQNTAAQEKSLREAGCEEVWIDKASAKDTEGRPQLLALLQEIGKGDTLVVSKLDRLARSVSDMNKTMELLNEKGANFLSLNHKDLDTSSTTGKLMFTLLSAIAEFERDLMLERQREGIEEAKRQGKYKGRKPTAKAKAKQVVTLAQQGFKRKEIAETLGIGIASVYRILKENREATS